MGPELASRLLLETAPDIEAAIDAVRSRHPQWGRRAPRVGIMPLANATIAGIGEEHTA
jgi:hypothetical protein